MDTRAKILDIAMNLSRIGGWAADDYEGKQERIKIFLENTTGYIDSLKTDKFPPKFKATFNHFLKEYSGLEKTGKKGPKDPLKWAEDMLTWGNILTHRTKLLP